MANRYSIAEARDQLARLVHEVEEGIPVELTRRGKPVAVLLSLNEYKKMREGNVGFWEAFERFRKKVDLADVGVEPEIFEDVRDRTRGREVRF
jgi:prevent-host-death family protein